MEYAYLGDTGLEVSRLCLGTMNFGDWGIDDHEHCVEVIDRAIDAGINFVDTANLYSQGESEAIVGEALAERDRDEIVVATKVYHRMREGPNGMGLSRKHVLEQAEKSLDRLGTDYVDLYQIHRWDDHTPVEETLSALDHLVDEGKVRYVGASTMAGWKLMKALERSDAENYERFVSIQPEYSLTRRHEELNALPVAEDQGLGVIPWSPLAGGFLTGKYERGEPAPEGSRLAERDADPEEEYDDDEWTVLDEVRAIAEAKGATPLQVSLAWLLHKDVVTAPIVGPKTVPQLEENLAALSVDLTDAEIERLEAPIDPAWARQAVDE
ncbi:aldo/keto reductase [Halostella sp. JP-L12]|uniref:aldo/keto reductase n=1 Tax=Halostella TaxID=1843185 RepID=UPI000EF776C5|nr:aldo/keto reductase [Halostella sp. JP-L12]